jgi:hypothetical protein
MEISKKEIVAAVAVVALGAIFIWAGDTRTNEEIDSRKSDFTKAGVIVFRGEGVPFGTPYLVYEEPGKPALTKELKFDALSTCGSVSQQIVCMALSVSFDVAFGGKRVLIEGISEDDGTVTIRKLQRLEE